MFIVAHRRFFFWLTGILLVAAIAAILVWGLPLGIDFTGGSLTQVKYANRPASAAIEEQVAGEHLGATSVRLSGADAVTIRTRSLTPAEHTHLLATLGATGANASTSAA